MKKQNASDYRSYTISVQDLFYPENPVEVSAPPAEYDDNNSKNNNRWSAVWAEATLLNDTKSSLVNGNDVFDAEAPEPSNGQNEAPVPPRIPSPVSTPDVVETPTHAANSSNDTATATSAAHTNNNHIDAPYHHGNLIEVLVGLTFALAAVAGTSAFELSTMVVYVIATTMYTMAKKFQHNHGLSGILLLLYSVTLGFALHICALVFIICSYALVLVDITLFICSIIIAELLAITAGILTSLFSCGRTGMIWHQYIRKLCHLSRWAFRDIYPSIDKEPKRMLPIRNKQNGVNETTPNNNTTTSSSTTPVNK